MRGRSGDRAWELKRPRLSQRSGGTGARSRGRARVGSRESRDATVELSTPNPEPERSRHSDTALQQSDGRSSGDGRVRTVRHPAAAPVPYRYAVATDPGHLAQIHALNHQTFAGEIPQHAPRADGRLVDTFDRENTYLVALDDRAPPGETVAGMLALRAGRPFSLDAKVPDLDRHLPEGPVVEIRLLAVRPERRHGRAFHGLMGAAARWMVHRGFAAAVISGTTRQLGLYRRLGFRPFGPLVGADGARFQPMICTRADALRVLPAAMPPEEALPSWATLSLLPGPVALSPAVREAFARPPISHRGAAFRRLHTRVVGRLRGLTGAPRVALLMGTGTTANEAVAAHLAAWGAPGVVLAAGAFGERLADHAARHGLRHTVLRSAWGGPPDLDALAAHLAAPPSEPPAWVWAAHGETSTGVLTDLPRLRALCRAHGARLCLDAVSTVGAVPVDLAGVALATAVSGKALGAPSGLAAVAYDELPPRTRPIPRALDLALYAQADGIPFTLSSPLLRALDAALAEATPARMDRLQRQGRALRRRLAGAGLALVAPESDALPTVLTVALGDAAWAVGERLEALGVQTSYRSGYLRERGWLQLCTMGAQTDAQVAAAAAALLDAVGIEAGRRGAGGAAAAGAASRRT